MRTVSMVFAVAALALVGTGVLAQCPPVVSEQPPVVAYPYSLPAAIGAGPAPELANITGPEFDRAYITRMYQLHTTVSALATQGIEQTMDKNLKDLSGKIRYEKTKQNEVLAAQYRDLGLGRIPVDYSRVQAILDTLVNYTGTDFDVQYARTMTALLMQTRDAAELGVSRLSTARLRDQAEIEAKAATNEINALQRWVGEQGPATLPPAATPGSVTTVPPCPAPATPAGTGTGTFTCPPMGSSVH